MTFLGSAPFTHTDPGDQRVVDPLGLSLGVGYPTSYLAFEQVNDLAEVWSYTVPANTKATIQGITVHASPSGLIGTTNFDHARDGQIRRGAVVTVSMDGTPFVELEAKVGGFMEAGGSTAIQYAHARDADLQTKFTFGDGIILLGSGEISGALLTASAVVPDLSHTLPGAHPTSYHLRLYGYRTSNGAPRSIEARCFPTDVGTFAFQWAGGVGEDPEVHEVGLGNMTLLGMSLRTEIGSNLVAAYNVLTLNGQYLATVGHFTSAGGSMAEPQHIPLWGAELFPGDKLALMSGLGPDVGQKISVVLNGVEESFGAYVAPSFVNVTPTSGTTLTSDGAEVTFGVNNPDELPFSIWLKFTSESRAFLVYDSLDGFKYPFTNSTVDVTNPLLPTFVLHQVGGWQDEIEDMRLGGVA